MFALAATYSGCCAPVACDTVCPPTTSTQDEIRFVTAFFVMPESGFHHACKPEMDRGVKTFDCIIAKCGIAAPRYASDCQDPTITGLPAVTAKFVVIST